MPEVGVHWITPSWSAVLHVPLERGRLFDSRDRKGARKSVLVSETAARTDVVVAVAKCEAAQDFVSREIAVHILEDAEDHIDFLETEIGLIEKVGEQNYLQTQIGESKES